MAAAGAPPPTTSAAPSPPPAGPSRSPRFMELALYGAVGLLHRARRRAGRAAGRLPHVAGGRPAVRRRPRPVPRRRVGAARPARPVHRRRRRRRARHAGPVRARRRAGLPRRHCATSPSRSPTAQRAAPPERRRVARRPAARADRRRRARQRAARQPAVPPRRATTAGWREAFVTDAGDGDVRRGAAGARSTRSRPCFPAAAGHGARAPLQAAAAALGRRGAGRSSRRGRVVVIDYARPTTAELAALAVAVVAAHVPRPRARRPLPRDAGRPGHHRRRRRRPAARARRRAQPGPVPPAPGDRRARRGGPPGVDRGGGARRTSRR